MPFEQGFDTGLGTGGPATMRIIGDQSQVLPPGIAGQAQSIPVVQAKLDYRVEVPQNSTGVAIGTGAVGDYISHVNIVPETLNAGLVNLIDGANTIRLFIGGTGSVGNLIPWTVACGYQSKNAGWTITTGANVHALVVGKF